MELWPKSNLMGILFYRHPTKQFQQGIDAKFAGNEYEEAYIKFDGEFSVGKGPFENAPLWDRLYPLNLPN